MSKFSLLQELYSLAPQMTVANNYNFNWSAVKSWDNGAFIVEDAPKLHIIFLPEQNNDASNGVGNNFQQIIIPMEIKFGKTLTAPSMALDVSDYQLEELESKMIEDISKMYASPFKINTTNAPEYCGTEYTGEGDINDAEENLDAYTVVGSMLFDITFKRDRRINE
ncbi:MAG: hypothetical protein U9N61_01635 [Euryarchaeota archaeon]|nr:hypothetical protein [Euryarchaeota archaeon]